MTRNRLEYRRELSRLESWREFSIRHLAFAFHRITGWLLLGWVALHLALPTVTAGPAVWNPLGQLSPPLAEAVVVGLFAVLVFHTFNGLRLIAAELFGAGIGTAKRVFQGTLVACALVVVGMGVLL